MAYNTEELFKKAKEYAKRKDEDGLKKMKGVVFFDDIISFLGISTSTFYDHFPKESKEYNELEAILKENKALMKSGIRAKWYSCDNPNAWKYLYLLLGTEEERHALHGSKTENKTELSGKIALEVSENAKTTVEEILEQ